jgi:hypothetical protein
MKKPTMKVIERWEYHDIINYIEKKYSINTMDYYGKFRKSTAQPWVNPDEEPPYANFWHYMMAVNPDVHNGSSVYFPTDEYLNNEVKDDPKCYDVSNGAHNGVYMYTPRFVLDIMGLITKEFGDEVIDVPIWVEW